MLTSKKILSFSIGPVQGFISQARKTKDSFSGSKILSDIIDHVLKATFKEDQIIFPDIKIESKPNRFIVIVDKDLKDEDIKAKIENEARQEFVKIADTTYKAIYGEQPKPVGFEEQIKNFLEIYWIALDYDENNYKKIYSELDSLMGAMKNTRIYSQIKYSSNSQIGEAGKKCAICGERNSLFYKKSLNNSSNSRQIKKNLMSREESLCAVCFTKRYYNYNKNSKTGDFPSTAEISLMNVLFKDKLYNKIKKIVDERNLNNIGDFSVDLLYEENLNINYIKENDMLYKELTSDEEKKLVKNLTDIKKKSEDDAKKKGLNLSKYYGIISFDGDNMGRWLSGDKIDEEKKPLIEYHKELSKLLGKFAQQVRKTVKPPKGKIIYAGGEDFLGFINLEFLFEVMKELRKLFDVIINEPLEKYYKDEKDNFTFSCGICISHYKTTLSNSINWAKGMEKKAKGIEGKNAFAIALLKRSGEIRMTKYKWQESEEKEYVIIKDIKNVLENIKGSHFSDNFIYELGKTIDKLPNEYKGIDADNKPIINSIIKSEIKRLVIRSAENVNNDEKINSMNDSLVSIYERSDLAEKSVAKNDNFMNLLYIIAFLTKEVYHDNRN